ncbi:MAG: 3-isopropylmalate dehydrogenase, partial [Peptococcaceae bacterium]|nr:3-isopropylmalate dehydrogenase [Peptococcaceae bacterium]MCL1792125.1 3-isopropylmalate dehydrogenase [Peptococcaceae bacterium]
EYKSETDSLSVLDYDKVLAYGLLYSVFMKVPKSDMTLSFAYTKHPRELLKYLEGERKFAVDDQGGGIYYIRGEIFPVQLLERNKLSKDNNVFLKMLVT